MEKPILPEETNYAAWMTGTVEPELATLCQEGFMTAGDGAKIRYAVYTPENPRAAILLVHGFTESLEKFYEIIWHMSRAGFTVCAIDNRGHGMSHRYGDDVCLTHVERFDEYLSDLKQLYDEVFLPAAGTLPKIIFGHSMGGAIAARFISEYPDCFRKAVLSSPMIRPRTKGVPMPLAKLIAYAFCAVGKGGSKLTGARPFDASERFEDSCDTSRARFEYYKAKREKTQYLQNSYPSYRWLRESFKLDKTLLNRENCEKVTADVLLYQAGLDRVVSNRYQNKYVGKIKNARKAVAARAKHEIYMSDNETMKEYLDTVFGFFTDNARR